MTWCAASTRYAPRGTTVASPSMSATWYASLCSSRKTSGWISSPFSSSTGSAATSSSPSLGGIGYGIDGSPANGFETSVTAWAPYSSLRSGIWLIFSLLAVVV